MKQKLIFEMSESIYQFCRTNMYMRKEIPVTNAEMGTLIYLYMHRDKKTVISSQIADYFDISKPGIANIISKLVIKGYIEKAECPLDKRKDYLSLSEKGERLIVTHMQVFNEKTIEIINTIGEEKSMEIIELLNTMTTILKKI